ncbi:protein max isoform X2 [Dunckerocampus dactyliophorus]|uniref:protein max isoform X2 n=1 Tax=Dunckerocampus dactyliophorus TaxID=161453 RepID=UPI0024067E3C|nr:protein max isoform X2 [Dunckerocampus dactyliophorus]
MHMDVCVPEVHVPLQSQGQDVGERPPWTAPTDENHNSCHVSQLEGLYDADDVTLILDTSMVHPSETMVMNKTITIRMLMVLSSTGDKKDSKTTALVFADVMLKGSMLSFCIGLESDIRPTMCSMEDSPRYHSVADKRAHHNALERKRRDHIKDSFHSLRDSVPALQGEKASRAQILDKATEYIQYMRRKNHTHQQDIDDLKRQNALLEQQVRALEKVKGSAQLQTNYSSSDSSLYTNPKGSAVSAFDGGSDSSSESEPEEPPNRKKLRVEAS